MDEEVKKNLNKISDMYIDRTVLYSKMLLNWLFTVSIAGIGLYFYSKAFHYSTHLWLFIASLSCSILTAALEWLRSYLGSNGIQDLYSVKNNEFNIKAERINENDQCFLCVICLFHTLGYVLLIGNIIMYWWLL